MQFVQEYCSFNLPICQQIGTYLDTSAFTGSWTNLVLKKMYHIKYLLVVMVWKNDTKQVRMAQTKRTITGISGYE